MKITNSNTIRSSEQELIDAINAELDWEAIEQMLFEKHKFALQDEVDYKNGDLVVYNDKIAYQFDFDIKVSLSVTFGRDGECLEISTSGDIESEVEDSADAFDEFDAKDSDSKVHNDQEKGDLSYMASNIADMISDINREGE
ncbi:MAG: hypothetical protein U9N77_12905 [Thermodesulfobacteriota bacterium]|nr:hypothetical protein [Thermodesulfobacteriota bacterium]